jgi:hypothetical protein
MTSKNDPAKHRPRRARVLGLASALAVAGLLSTGAASAGATVFASAGCVTSPSPTCTVFEVNGVRWQ